MTGCKGAGPELAATDPETPKNVGCGKPRSSKPQPSDPQAAPKSWRDVLPVHPAADLFPLMAPDELKSARRGHQEERAARAVDDVEGAGALPTRAAGWPQPHRALSAAGST